VQTIRPIFSVQTIRPTAKWRMQLTNFCPALLNLGLPTTLIRVAAAFAILRKVAQTYYTNAPWEFVGPL
jgi:hypothetical protein